MTTAAIETMVIHGRFPQILTSYMAKFKAFKVPIDLGGYHGNLKRSWAGIYISVALYEPYNVVYLFQKIYNCTFPNSWVLQNDEERCQRDEIRAAYPYTITSTWRSWYEFQEVISLHEPISSMAAAPLADLIKTLFPQLIRFFFRNSSENRLPSGNLTWLWNKAIYSEFSH